MENDPNRDMADAILSVLSIALLIGCVFMTIGFFAWLVKTLE